MKRVHETQSSGKGFSREPPGSLRPWGWRWGEGNTLTGGRRRFRVGWNWEPDRDGSARPACGMSHTRRWGGSLELSECLVATTGQTSDVYLLVTGCHVQRHGTDLDGFSPWICTGAARCILCVVQQMTGGTRQSLCRTWIQNLHTALCSYWVWGHRSPPWASSKFPAGKWWENMDEELFDFVCLF